MGKTSHKPNSPEHNLAAEQRPQEMRDLGWCLPIVVYSMGQLSRACCYLGVRTRQAIEHEVSKEAAHDS